MDHQRRSTRGMQVDYKQVSHVTKALWGGSHCHCPAKQWNPCLTATCLSRSQRAGSSWQGNHLRAAQCPAGTLHSAVLLAAVLCRGKLSQLVEAVLERCGQGSKESGAGKAAGAIGRDGDERRRPGGSPLAGRAAPMALICKGKAPTVPAPAGRAQCVCCPAIIAAWS